MGWAGSGAEEAGRTTAVAVTAETEKHGKEPAECWEWRNWSCGRGRARGRRRRRIGGSAAVGSDGISDVGGYVVVGRVTTAKQVVSELRRGLTDVGGISFRNG